MKKIAIGIAAATLTLAGTAYAANEMRGGGSMTRAEAQTHATEMFGKMDVNKDGKLDAADRAAHQAQRFDNIDTNKDGALSRAEFESHRGGHDRADGAREAGHEGKRGHGGRMGRHHGGRGMEMMAQMADTNKDGAISPAEFTAGALTKFERADANKDGQVTAAERRAAHAAMRGMMRGATPAPAQ